MKWDLNDFAARHEENNTSFSIAEATSRSEEDLYRKLKEAGIEPPTAQELKFDIDEVEPTEADTIATEAVKGGLQGFLFDVGENIITSVEEFQPDSLDKTKVIFNIPGLNNYDKTKPYVFTMEGDEFDRLKEEKKISYLPQIANEGTATFEFTRTMGKVIRGIQMGGVVTKPITGGTGALSYVAPGAVGSQISFNPYEERTANLINEIIQDTPYEVAAPFFEWLEADDDNTEAEERFKMALESIALDATFGAVFKLWRARRSILKSQLLKKPSDEIAKIEAEEVASIRSNKVTKKELATGNPEYTGKSPATKVLNAKLEDPTIFASPDAAKRIVETLVRGDFRDVNPTGYRVFNTKYLEDEGAAEAINMFETLIRKEMSRKVEGLDVPKGPKTLAEIEEQGLTLADTIQGQRISNLTEDTAGQLGLEKDVLMELMMKDLNDVAGLEARILAYRGVISQYGAELQSLRKQIMNNPDNNAVLRARFHNLLMETEDALRVFGEVRRTAARATTAQRIKVPNMNQRKVNTDEVKDFYKALEDSGMDTKKTQLLAEVLGMGKGPLESVRLAQIGRETWLKKGARGLMEFYRGMLLASAKTHVTNVVSGTVETMVTPFTRVIGGALTGDKELVKETGRHIIGLGYGFNESFMKMIDSIWHERNILDPMGTKIDGLISPYGNGIAMSKLAPDQSSWHPVNWLTQAVNYTGKIARGSMRLLGGEDEFFKQWNYRAQAFAKITKNVPENLTRAQRKDYIAREMDKYFNDVGVATDQDLLQYSRKITFTEELRRGSWSDGLHKASVKFPPLQLFLPFIRTPVNILGRAVERTPILNMVRKHHRDMFMSGDKTARAQAVGNTALGTMLWGSAMYWSMSGRITGGGPIDPDQNKLWRQAGNQPYSILTPSGNWVSYNRLDPTAMPFVFAASAYENAHVFAEEEGTLEEMALMGILGGIRAMSDRTYLQGLKTMADSITMTTTGNADRWHEPFVQLGANMIPGIIQQSHDVATSYGLYEGAEGFQEAIQWQEKFLRRAPQLTGYNAIKHNWITGEPVVSPFGYNTGIPVAPDRPNKYINEIVRMGRSIDPPDTYMGNVELNGPQYAELNRLIGTTEIGGMRLTEALQMFMESEDYNFNPNRRYDPDYDDFRVKGVKKILRRYKDAGKKRLLSSDPKLLDLVIQDKINEATVLQGDEAFFDLNQR